MSLFNKSAEILNYGFSFLRKVIFVMKEHKRFLIIGKIFLVSVHEGDYFPHQSHVVASQ